MNASSIIKMIGRPSPPRVMLVDEQGAVDIMRGIAQKHRECAADYDKFSNQFASGSVVQICEKLFDFCRGNLTYYEEKKNSQYLSAPQTILARGYSDCKGYALFIGGVLDSLRRSGKKISWFYRFASYELFQNRPSHVFVVVDSPSGEIWVDPVFSVFNLHEPYWNAIDRRVHTAEAIGCAPVQGNCDCHKPCQGTPPFAMGAGSTASQTGTVIMKIAPVLAYIPVVGWIADAALVIVGGIISIVGSHWTESDDVRWLIQLKEYYADGIKTSTNDHNVRNPNTPQTAQAFFSVVLGVPIGGRKDFNILQSGNGNTNTPSGDGPTKRATNYLAWKGLTGKIDISQAIEAANIAAGLDPANFGAGGWAGLVPAPSTIDKTGAVPVSTAGQGLPAQLPGPVTGGINPLLILGAAVGLYFVMK